MLRIHHTVTIGLAALALACSTGKPSPGVAPVVNARWTPPAETARKTEPHGPAVAPPAGPISLAQIIDVALANNPDTQTAWLTARAAEAGLGSERADYYPQVDVLANATRSRSASENAESQTVLAPSVALTYLLFDFGGRDARVEQARQTLIAADFLHNQVIQDVILRVEQVYYQYLAAVFKQ